MQETATMNGIFGRHSVTRTAFLLVIVCFLLSTVVSLVSLYIMNQQTERDTNRVLATQIYDYMNAELSGPIAVAQTMSYDSFLIDSLASEQDTDEQEFADTMSRYLAGIEKGLGYDITFVISNTSRRYFTRDGVIRTIETDEGEHDTWYEQLVQDTETIDLDVDGDEANPNDLNVYVNAKVKAKGSNRHLLGVCGVGLRMTGIQELFRTFEQNFGVKIDLVDSNGVVQVDTDNGSIETKDMSSIIAGKKSDDYVYEELGGGGFAVTRYLDNIDWFLVVQSAGGGQEGKVANIVLVNALLCLVVLIAMFVALRINARRTSALESESLADHLTGLGNKRALERDQAKLGSKQLAEDFAFVVADLNGLKSVNDGLGHEAGDELIKGAADCLRAVFSAYGTVYRTGGDEYAALIRVPASNLASLKQELEQAGASWKGEHVQGLTLSCGFAPLCEFPHADIETLGAIADERMYEDKDRYYRETGKKRR